MNNFWSENVQGIQTLYLSRKLRFHDIFKNQYMELFGLDTEKKLRILEIGCGPGALSGTLHRWYPNAEITAIDRDSKFIEFAGGNEPGVEFIEGNAVSLPFKDNSFDVTVSYTVSEHIETDIFYSEQKRVLKKNGVCLVLSARKGVTYEADCLKETVEEEDFWKSVDVSENILKTNGVGKYAMTEQELPASMEKAGFSDVSAGYAVIPLTPDNPSIPKEVSGEIIQAKREMLLEAVRSTNKSNAENICDIISMKFDKRLEMLQEGVKQWDTYTSITMIVRGCKK